MGSERHGQALELVVLRRAADDEALLRRAFDEVLRPSFTPDELPGWDELVEEVDDGGDQVLVALDDGEVAGVAVAGIGDPDEVALLGFLAARPGGRSRGVGSFLLDHLRDRWREAGAALVVAEVHDPRVHARSEDERPDDRLRFYERHGATVLGPWVQPALADGVERVRGMLLLELHRGRPEVPPGALADFVEAYFAFSEGGVPDDDEYRELQRRLAEAPPGGGPPVRDHHRVPLL